MDSHDASTSPRGDVRLIRSPMSVVGMVLTTVSAVVFLTVFLADLFGFHEPNPYVGILFFLVLPTIFLVGLALIPLGAWIERRRRNRGRRSPEVRWPRLDLNDSHHRRVAVAIFALTMANIVIVSLAAYRGVEHMDSVGFCGQTCHVMEPEFVAHQDAPHSQVRCVECHIGSGAASFAEAKLAGTRRVVQMLRGSYSKPIPAPADNPQAGTCEKCHWPEKFHGDKVRTIHEYAEDAANTETVTILQVHVGGGSARLGLPEGIHWHMNVSNEVDYIATDNARQTIPWVRVKDRFGNVREYVVDGVTEEQLAQGTRRRMDCMDCHNRPAHSIAATPERAVNDRIARGEIPKTLPFIRREAVKALKASYRDRADAEQRIVSALTAFYASEQQQVFAGRREEIERVARAVADIYRRNVFPEMAVTFGTYRNNIGHVDFPGCFRCHDDNHKSKDGKTIGQECETCHRME